MRLFKKKYYCIPLILLLLFIIPVVFPSFYIIRLLTTMLIYLIIVMSLNLMLGYTHLISIGHAGIYGLAAYSTGILIKNIGMNFWMVLPIVLLIGAFIGIFIGIVTLKLKQAYLAITTLGFALIFQNIALNWREVTGGIEGFLGVPKPVIYGYTIKSPTAIFYIVLIFSILAFLIIRNITKSKWGTSMRAVRDNEIAASMMGINVVEVKLLSFTVSAVLTSLSGWLYAGLYGGIFPDYFNMDLSVLFLCMVVLGGAGTVAGPVIGVTLITFGLEVLRSLGETQMLVYGILIVALCVLKPGGVIEIVNDIKRRMTPKKTNIELPEEES